MLRQKYGKYCGLELSVTGDKGWNRGKGLINGEDPTQKPGLTEQIEG